jgi:hypothetical protein
MRRAFAYTLTVSQVGPANDPEYIRAPAHVKDEVRRWIVVYGLKEKDADLAQGLDARGKPLKPVKPATAEHRDSEQGPADPMAPALMPASAVSRTRLLLEGEAVPAGAHFWWEYDPYTGGSWGQILDYHRKARTKRDVIGLSPAAVARVRDQVMKRWAGWKAAGLRPGWRPDRAPIPQLQDIVVRGGTAYDQYTYGIGGSDAATLRDALARKRATGFYQYEPGRGLTAYGGPRGIWEPPTPPKPPPAPKPKPKPAPAAIDRPAIMTAGNVPDDFYKESVAAIESLPPKVLSTMRAHGVRFVIADRMENAHPEIADESPRGWPEGTTWKNADGIYRISKKQVTACRERKSLVTGDYVRDDRPVSVLMHETGHGFDDSLKTISVTEEYRKAYEQDLAEVPGDVRTRLSYLFQPGFAGQQETFAEVFAHMMGHGVVDYNDLPALLPRVAAFIKRLIE